MTINQAVAELRRRLDLKQEEFASLLGATVVSVSRWEHRFPPSRKYLQKLALLARETGATHLEEFFEATRRASIVSKGESLSSSKSPRRISISELDEWAKNLQLIIDGTTAHLDFLDRPDLDVETIRTQFKPILNFWRHVAAYTQSEINLRIWQPHLKPVTLDELSEAQKALMLPPGSNVQLAPALKKGEKLPVTAKAWIRQPSISKTMHPKEEPGHQAKSKNPSPSPPKKLEENSGPKKRVGLGRSRHLPKPRKNK